MVSSTSPTLWVCLLLLFNLLKNCSAIFSSSSLFKYRSQFRIASTKRWHQIWLKSLFWFCWSTRSLYVSCNMMSCDWRLIYVGASQSDISMGRMLNTMVALKPDHREHICCRADFSLCWKEIYFFHIDQIYNQTPNKVDQNWSLMLTTQGSFRTFSSSCSNNSFVSLLCRFESFDEARKHQALISNKLPSTGVNNKIQLI